MPAIVNSTLLTRDEFRAAIFARDQWCVVCRDEIQDAHHLVERRLWPDGGYYLDNGVGLCGKCHLAAERTLLSPSVLRVMAGINTVHLPPHFDDECEYDKWGNPVWPDLTRAKGPLFNDESVQKALSEGKVLHLFKPYYKHARTPHLPWSPNGGSDGDGVKDVFSEFSGDIIVTRKLDGEQITMYSDHYHARSVESGYHASRTWVANLHGKIAHEIPEGWRIVGENLFAAHSITYCNLPTYFFVFAIFDENNRCLSWTETEEWAQMLGLQTVPLLHGGPYDREFLENTDFWEPNDWGEVEGYVVRAAAGFAYESWDLHVGKVVRKDHVKTDQHWRHKPIVPNGLSQ